MTNSISSAGEFTPETLTFYAAMAGTAHAAVERTEEILHALNLTKGAWATTKGLGGISRVGAFLTSPYFIYSGAQSFYNLATGQSSNYEQDKQNVVGAAFAALNLVTMALCPGRIGVQLLLAGASLAWDIDGLVDAARHGASRGDIFFRALTVGLMNSSKAHRDYLSNGLEAMSARAMQNSTHVAKQIKNFVNDYRNGPPSSGSLALAGGGIVRGVRVPEEMGRAPVRVIEPPRVVKMSGDNGADGVYAELRDPRLPAYNRELLDSLLPPPNGPIIIDKRLFEQVNVLTGNFSGNAQILARSHLVGMAFPHIANELQGPLLEGKIPVISKQELTLTRWIDPKEPLMISVKTTENKARIQLLALTYTDSSGAVVATGKISIGIVNTFVGIPLPKSWDNRDGWEKVSTSNKTFSIKEVEGFAQGSGDNNAPHIPGWAQKTGLKDPVVHGLCLDHLATAYNITPEIPGKSVTKFSHFLPIETPVSVFRKIDGNTCLVRIVNDNTGVVVLERVTSLVGVHEYPPAVSQTESLSVNVKDFLLLGAKTVV